MHGYWDCRPQKRETLRFSFQLQKLSEETLSSTNECDRLKCGQIQHQSQLGFMGLRVETGTRRYVIITQNTRWTIIMLSGFSLGLSDRALRPVVFPQRPVVFPVPSFSEIPLVSSGFYQRYFELQVAESIQLRGKVVRFSCTTLLFASDIATILDLRHRFRHESEATLMAFEGMSFLQLFTWKVVQGFMNINKIQ